MNAVSRRKALLTTIAALVLAAASTAARADDMAGMKMDKGPTEKKEKTQKMDKKEPAAEAGGAKAKKGAELMQRPPLQQHQGLGRRTQCRGGGGHSCFLSGKLGVELAFGSRLTMPARGNRSAARHALESS